MLVQKNSNVHTQIKYGIIQNDSLFAFFYIGIVRFVKCINLVHCNHFGISSTHFDIM